MKRFLMVCVALLFVCTCQTGLTENEKIVVIEDVVESLAPKYESAIDLMVIQVEWEKTDMFYIAGAPIYIYRNPDRDADIQCAAIIVYYDMIMGYLYLENDYVYFWGFDEKTMGYQLRDCDQEQWKKNFKDHCLLVGCEKI